MASLEFMLAAYAEGTGRQPIGLLTLSHSSFATLRYCTGGEVVVSRGNVFSPLWFDVRFPSIDDTSIQQGEIRGDNTGEEPIASFRTATSPITARIETVLANATGDGSAIDRVEHTARWKILPNISYNANEWRARLGYETVLGDAWPQVKFTPNTWPGVFSLALLVLPLLR